MANQSTASKAGPSTSKLNRKQHLCIAKVQFPSLYIREFKPNKQDCLLRVGWKCKTTTQNTPTNPPPALARPPQRHINFKAGSDLLLHTPAKEQTPFLFPSQKMNAQAQSQMGSSKILFLRDLFLRNECLRREIFQLAPINITACCVAMLPYFLLCFFDT